MCTEIFAFYMIKWRGDERDDSACAFLVICHSIIDDLYENMDIIKRFVDLVLTIEVILYNVSGWCETLATEYAERDGKVCLNEINGEL